jgi:hypothetical protein
MTLYENDLGHHLHNTSLAGTSIEAYRSEVFWSSQCRNDA